jgi:hypothetical protein
MKSIATDPHVLATWVNEIDGYKPIPIAKPNPSEFTSGVKEIVGVAVPLQTI